MFFDVKIGSKSWHLPCGSLKMKLEKQIFTRRMRLCNDQKTSKLCQFLRPKEILSDIVKYSTLLVANESSEIFRIINFQLPV